MQHTDTTQIETTVPIPDDVLDEIEQELREMDQVGNKETLIELACERLSIEFIGIPQAYEAER